MYISATHNIPTDSIKLTVGKVSHSISGEERWHLVIRNGYKHILDVIMNYDELQRLKYETDAALMEKWDNGPVEPPTDRTDPDGDLEPEPSDNDAPESGE